MNESSEFPVASKNVAPPLAVRSRAISLLDAESEPSREAWVSEARTLLEGYEYSDDLIGQYARQSRR